MPAHIEIKRKPNATNKIRRIPQCKNWKKLLATGLSTALILGTLASCGGGNTSSPAASSGAAASGSGSDASSTTTTNFPDGKSLSMIIHASPGGLSDTNARFIAQMVSDELGVPFPATNMTGGSGVVAMTYVKESTPDGYTVGYLPCELAMVKAQGLTEIIEPSAFDMIYACNIQPAAITVSADSEWDSIEDLVAWCKEHPGELQVGTSGTGSVWHIAADAFAKAAGIEINLVPFDGAATAVTNLMGGHVQMVPVSESEVASGVASGKLKILAVCSSDRSEFNPDVPLSRSWGMMWMSPPGRLWRSQGHSRRCEGSPVCRLREGRQLRGVQGAGLSGAVLPP